MKYIIDTNNFPLSDYTKWVHDNATPLNDCVDAISRSAVIKASSKLCVSDECCKCQFDENAKCRLKSYKNYISTLPSVNPTTDLSKIRAEIEPKCDRIYNLISIYPYAERRDIQEMLCEIMDLCDAEMESE